MHKNFQASFIIVAFLVIVSTACNNTSSSTTTMNDSGNTARASDTATGGAPVETQEPNTDYKPAFPGQTRIGSVKTSASYSGKVLTSELESPWGIVQLPDGRFLITQKEGTMRIATGTGQLSEPITGLPAVNSRGQGGL